MREIVVVADRIYGTHQIENPLLMELMQTQEMQRLKCISQLGVPEEFLKTKGFSRWEHSVGVTLLLKALGASEEEQLAGLTHDVSHTAFSHVYDWVIDDYSHPDPKENWQDRRHAAFIFNSAIPAILEKYGLNLDTASSLEQFSLLEQDLPNLCADRVDYSLRQMSKESARVIFRGLTVSEGKIVCRDRKIASLFGRTFLQLQREVWGNFEAISRYHHFSAVLRRALELGVIGREDFWGDENAITEKLKESNDNFIRDVLQSLRNPRLTPPMTGKIMYKRFRHIDPEFIDSNNIFRLSEEDRDFKKLLEHARQENEKGVMVTDVLA